MRRLLLLLLPVLTSAQDLLLHHGKIVSVDPEMTLHEAVLIEGGRIRAVGASEALMARARGQGTPMLDLEGRTVLPGLVDNHVHALSAGMSEYREPLPPLDSFAAVQDYIRQRAKKTPKGRWIVVPRTFPTRLAEMRMPTKDVLDVARDHPVMFDASYTVVVNSKGLEISKIAKFTANPPGGEIVVDDSGEPNGILKNAQGLLEGLEAAEELTREEKLDALEKMLHRYRAAGLTAVGDRAVNGESIALYRELHEQGKLPVRVVMTWRPGASAPFGEILRDLREQELLEGDAMLALATYKVTLDGGMTIGTAFQRRPYGEFGRQLYGMTNPDNRGMRFVGPEKLLSIFRKARDRGWQLTSHAQGGGAIDTFLSVLEEMNEDRPIAKERHHLMHASFQSPEAIRKMARLGVSADVQLPWLYFDGPALEKVMGTDGMRYFIPLRTYIDNGVRPAGGSDHMVGFDKNRAVNPYNPFFQMWMAITRARTRGAEPLFAEEEGATREEALRMHTIWAAEQQFAEDERGTIEVGKLADLVVIDRDYLTCPTEEIREIEPLMTILEGEIVYQR